MTIAVDEILPEVLRLLAERAGMAPESLGASGITHALRARVAASGAASSQDYPHRLGVDPTEFQELVENLVVPETWFFRDTLAFRCLAHYLAAARARNQAAIRVLSIGCSTGEEVYSLAIALREAGFTPAQSLVLGVDMSRRSLDLARAGRFTSRSFREADELGGTRRERWCARVGESWQVCDELREGVEFRWGNLADPEFLSDEPPFHVVFCRNVLIYFHAEARRTAVGHIHRLLSPEGFVCSAPAEARIFSESGFRGLGSECPFAFRRQDAPADAPANIAPGSRPQVTPRPIRNDPASLPAAPRRPGVPIAATLSSGSVVREELSVQALLDAARQAADDGRLDEASTLCDRMLSRDPASADAHYLRGVVRQAQGKLDDAQQSLQRALYLDPKHYQALVHMMLLAGLRGDEQAAANYRRRAQQTVPEAP